MAAPGAVRGVPLADIPLYAALAVGIVSLLPGLLLGVVRGQFSSDLLAGISIVTAVLLGQYLAGTLVVLMLSGGQALEAAAVSGAASALHALAKRMPSRAHRRAGPEIVDVSIGEVGVGDVLIVLPHEVCPVDGTVLEGHSTMDESYLTGEPYVMSKAPGSAVLSGTINGEGALVIRADKPAVDSRYSKIMQVMRESEQRRPQLRRLGDRLGAFYTPLALAIAAAAWVASARPERFLAVLVVATPCPLLIAIPVAIIGSISLAARRGIIIKDPGALEQIENCRTAIFDKTGTLTYGKPTLDAIVPAPGRAGEDVLRLLASIEHYSRHPLAQAIVDAARAQRLSLSEASRISERPGEGLQGTVEGRQLQITSRNVLRAIDPASYDALPPTVGGLECVVLMDGRYAATCRFRDQPRADGRPFVRHLTRRHRFERVVLVSGDRATEVEHLAAQIGISEVHAGQSPEEKLALVRRETEMAPTVFVGDGINDAPALTAATVGVAFGTASDVTAEAAGAVVLDTSLQRVDELLHIGRRMRAVALQSAVGGMALSLIGMLFAAYGHLSPVAGAVAQELIDVVAVANAMRAAVAPRALSDY